MVLDPRRYSVSARPMHEFGPATFDELMADQLRRAPWFLISVLSHAILILTLMMIPPERVAQVEDFVRLEKEEPAEEIKDEVEPEEIIEEEVPDEPVLQDVEIQEQVTDAPVSEDFLTDATAVAAVDESNWNTAVGLGGGGGGGKFGKRRGGRRALRNKGGRSTAKAIEDGLTWLRLHQDEDGRWNTDRFMEHDDGEACDGAGNPIHDVGVTGLALLAFLGDGSDLRSGPDREVVKKAVNWLRRQQDQNGLFGTDTTHAYIYDHAIAALAMVEAYGLSDYKLLRRYAQGGIDCLEAHRNPHLVWRYHPQDNDNDTSVTGWAVMAYKSAQDFGLRVNDQAMERSTFWFDEMTDPTTGRCGYTKRGELSSREAGDHASRFPPAKGEALTAVGLMCRFFLGQDPEQCPVMTRAADTLLKKPPVWKVEGGAIDHYYWYYGTYALYQMGGRHWRNWSKHLARSVVRTQRTDGNYLGSWDPVGVWGDEGGRVYSTAILVLTLEAYYRYTRVFVR